MRELAGSEWNFSSTAGGEHNRAFLWKDTNSSYILPIGIYVDIPVHLDCLAHALYIFGSEPLQVS